MWPFRKRQPDKAAGIPVLGTKWKIVRPLEPAPKPPLRPLPPRNDGGKLRPVTPAAPRFARVALPTRVEHIRIELALDKSRADKHAAVLDELVGKACPAIDEGDTLKVSYDFRCEYWGGVERKLASISALLADPAIVVRADLAELLHGQSVIVGIVDRLRAMQRQIESRAQAALECAGGSRAVK